MSSLTGFFIGIGVVSLIFFGLMIRADGVRDRRRAYADSAGGDTSGISPGNDGFGLLNWFSGTLLHLHPTIPAHRPRPHFSAAVIAAAATGEAAAEMVAAAAVATSFSGILEPFQSISAVSLE